MKDTPYLLQILTKKHSLPSIGRWWPTSPIFPVSGLSRFGRSFEPPIAKCRRQPQPTHNLAADGRLARFAMPYLGQQDVALLWIPPDLVRREQVASYPTNFALWLTLTSTASPCEAHLLIERWCPDP